MAGGFDPATYDQVDSRLARFWSEHPSGSIQTYLLSDPNAPLEVVFRAEAFFERTDDKPAGTGHAFGGNQLGGLADKKAWLENGETSAIGRALANCGYKAKIDSPRPSYQEMEKAGAFDRQPAQSNGYQRQGPAPVAAVTGDGEEFEQRFSRGMKTVELVEYAKKHGFLGTNARQLREEVERTFKVKIKGTAPDGGALPCDIANAIGYFVGKQADDTQSAMPVSVGVVPEEDQPF